MMRWIVGASLRFRFLVLPVAVALLALGIIQLRDPRADVLPEFMPPTVEVRTEALGLSAEEVEQLITAPMEEELLNGVAFLDEIRSESIPGLSAIELVFEPGTDELRARQLVAERLTLVVGLPHLSKPPEMLQPRSSTNRVMVVGLSSESLSLIDMSVLARWRIKPRLMGVPGVANVAIYGQRERQLQVRVDPERLRENGVTVNQVMQSTGNALWMSPLSFVEASTPGSGGFIDTPNQRLGIHHRLPIRTPEHLAQVVIEDTGGKRLRLTDVAAVTEDHQPLIGDAVVKNAPSLMLVIEKFPGTDTRRVSQNVEASLAAMAPGLSGITMDSTIYRPATFIDIARDNLATALLIGLLLLVILLGALFFDWRSAVIALVAIPLSLLAGGLVLHFGGATFNMMILAGFAIAVGAVVDDAVIGVENIRRRLRRHREANDDRSTAAIVVDATLEVRTPVIYATLIVLLAAVPVFLLTGVTGSLTRPLILTYALALLVSTLVALMVVPALSLLLLSGAPLKRSETPIVRSLERGYGSVLSRFVQRPRWAYASVAAFAAVGFGLLPVLGVSLLPTLKDPNLLIHWDGPPGTSHPEMSRITASATRELRSIPGVRNVGAHLGRAITSDEVENVNSAEIWVSVDPRVDYDKTVAAVENVIGGYPGLTREIMTYPAQRVQEERTGQEEDLVVRVYGTDLAALRTQANKVRHAVAQVDGVTDPQVDLEDREPTLVVRTDLAAAQQHGVKPGDVRRAAATLVSGIEVGALFEEQKIFEVVVWGAPELRRSLTDVRNLLIDTPGDDHVRLGDVADVRIMPTLTVVEHDATSRYLDITANVDGRDVGSAAREIDRRIENIAFPVEYHAEVLGGYAEQQAEQQRLIAVAVAAAVGILLLLQASFGSWRLAGAVFLTLPPALVGGMLAAWVGGGVLTLGSLVGFLAVLGIAARNAVLLVDHYQNLGRHEGVAFGPDLVLRGAMERLSPILTTTLATAVVLAPFVFLGDVPGLEVVHPLAVVVLGGLVTTTLVALFVIPALYLRLGHARDAQPSGSGPRTDPASS